MIPSFIYLDRYRNEDTRTYSPHAAYSEADERYRPNAGHKGFELPSFLIPARELQIYRANPSKEVEAAYLPGDDAIFCIHPQVLERQADDPYVQRTLSLGQSAPAIPVVPTSSTRTLAVVGAEPGQALKVHFPFRVSRYGRRMRNEVVAQAIAVSAALEAGISSMGTDFAFMREVLGVTHKNLRPESPRGEQWGYLVRETAPFPHSVEPGGLRLVPGFALYGRDYFEPEAPPLILELIGSARPNLYVLDNIMFPIIQQWVSCFSNFGFLLEPHAQNVILEISDDDRIQRIVHRDLSLGIDMRRRRALGLSDGDLNEYNRMETGDFNSIVYDKFMGGHFFDALVARLKEFMPGIRATEFEGPCREEFARIFPEHEDYFPRTIRYFSEERDQFGKPSFVDTGEAPRWRP